MGFDYTLATSGAVVAPIGLQVSKVIATDQLNELKKTAKDLEQNKGVDADALAKAMAYFQKVMANIDVKGKSEEEVYALMQANPIVAAKDGYIDNVVEATNLRPYLASALMMTLGI